MSLNWKQVVASVCGAVFAAVILSRLVGALGTVLAVAIGSAVATIGSSLVFGSLEKGHQKVKALVESDARSSLADSSSVSPPPPLKLEAPIEVSGEATVLPAKPAPPPLHGAPRSKSRRWPVVAMIGLVFVVSMGTITVVELAAGKPMTSIVNGSSGSSGDTSIGNIFGTNPSTTTTTSTTKPDTSTTTSSTTTSSTTTTSTSTTTTTTQP